MSFRHVTNSLAVILALPVLVLAAIASADMPDLTPSFDIADKVIVRKSTRKLYLLKKGRIINSYDIRLGLNPDGDKVQEGDFRTPEGLYLLDQKITDSEFFMAIHISYPDTGDIRDASELGVDPGGNIMIHGLPNELKQPMHYYRDRDWTNGCIAVSNSALVEIWLQTRINTPIEIYP